MIRCVVGKRDKKRFRGHRYWRRGGKEGLGNAACPTPTGGRGPLTLWKREKLSIFDFSPLAPPSGRFRGLCLGFGGNRNFTDGKTKKIHNPKTGWEKTLPTSKLRMKKGGDWLLLRGPGKKFRFWEGRVRLGREGECKRRGFTGGFASFSFGKGGKKKKKKKKGKSGHVWGAGDEKAARFFPPPPRGGDGLAGKESPGGHVTQARRESLLRAWGRRNWGVGGGYVGRGAEHFSAWGGDAPSMASGGGATAGGRKVFDFASLLEKKA